MVFYYFKASFCHLWKYFAIYSLYIFVNAVENFYKQDKIGNNANIGNTMWKQKKSSNKMLPPVSIEPGPLIKLWFQVQHSPFLANLARSLNFSSSTTWFLNLEDLEDSWLSWLSKEPKV